MKRLVLIAIFAVVAMAVAAQPHTVTSVDVDTLNGAETVYFETENFSFGWEEITIQAACDNVGGTSDGTVSLEGSVDGTDWVPLAEQSGIVHGYATTGENDSLTITDNANIAWVISGSPFYQYRIKGEGTASDSTLVTVKYIFKR